MPDGLRFDPKLAIRREVEGAGFGFDEEALAAIRASIFRAVVRDGRPVVSRALLPVRFMLRGSGDD